MVLQIKITIRG